MTTNTTKKKLNRKMIYVNWVEIDSLLFEKKLIQNDFCRMVGRGHPIVIWWRKHNRIPAAQFYSVLKELGVDTTQNLDRFLKEPEMTLNDSSLEQYLLRVDAAIVSVKESLLCLTILRGQTMKQINQDRMRKSEQKEPEALHG